MPNKAITIDANILIRAVLGQRVRRILEKHCGITSFFLPATSLSLPAVHPEGPSAHGLPVYRVVKRGRKLTSIA